MLASQQTPGVAAGQMTPFDANSDFDVVRFQIEQMIALLDTMKLGQVVAVHGGGTGQPAGTVDVQLLVSTLDGQGNAEAPGIVYGVRWFRLQAGPWAIVADPAVGDVGSIVCSDRDVSNLKTQASIGATLQPVNPASLRKMSVSDGVWFNGVLCAAATAYMALNSDGSFKLLDGFGNSVQSSATGITLADVNGNQMQMKAGAVNFVTAALQVNGTPITVP